MKIYICVLISKKNIKFLHYFLNSLKRIIIPKNYKLKIIFIFEPRMIDSKNLIKKRIKNFKYLFLINSKKENIPNSRNIFLKYLKKKNFTFAGFLDDDCIIDCKWLLNMIKFMNLNNCDIAGGPQKHQLNKIRFKAFYDVLEPKRFHGETVSWVATNNCFFSKKILKTNVTFDEDLSNYGGSDQLFFNNFFRKKYSLKWNNLSYVTELSQMERENKFWFFKRNLRYGYSGNIMDQKIYGNISIIVILSKIFYLSLIAFLLLFLPTKKNFLKSIFFFCRVLGRLGGLFNYKPKKYI